MAGPDQQLGKSLAPAVERVRLTDLTTHCEGVIRCGGERPEWQKHWRQTHFTAHRAPQKQDLGAPFSSVPFFSLRVRAWMIS